MNRLFTKNHQRKSFKNYNL